jgi:hypothetical protein
MGIHGYTARHRSMLKAVAEGRAELSGGSVPNLTVDGLWCDFTATTSCAQEVWSRQRTARSRANGPARSSPHLANRFSAR